MTYFRNLLSANFKWHAGATLAAVFVFALLSYLINLQQDLHESDETLQSAIYANLLRAEVDRELNALLFISNGLASYIAAYDRELSPSKINLILKDLWQRAKYVRNLGVAVQYRMTYIYPEDNNKQIIGKDFRDIPKQWPKVKQAVETKKGVLNGPLELLQGGRGLIYRYPVFVDDAYWGILSTVIDVDAFLNAAFKASRDGRAFAIRNVSSREVFYGKSALFDDPSTFKQITEVPNGQWEWAIQHRENRYERHILTYRLISILVSVLCGLLVYQVLKYRHHLAALANLDSLTNLPNRRVLDIHMAQSLTAAKRTQKKMAMMAIDVDYFKKINDTYGHDVGDEVLRVVASSIQSVIRETDTVSRTGGDEFIVVLNNITLATHAVTIANKLKASLHAPLTIAGHTIAIHLSIGIALYHHDRPKTLKQLVKEADIALYQAKANGRNGYSVYEEG